MKRLFVLAVVLLAAGEAGAATYTQHVCRAGGEPAPAEGVVFSASSGTAGADNCKDGGNLHALLTSKASSSFVEVKYAPPTFTRLVGLEVLRSTRYVGSASNATYELAGTADRCAPAGCSGVSGTFEHRTSELQEAVFSLSCPDTGCAGATGTYTPELIIESMRLTLQDDFAPGVNAYFPAGPTEGLVAINYDATDRGGGVFQAEVVVDGTPQPRQVVDDNAGSCRTPFVKRVPCKTSVSATAHLDTTQLTNGDHTIALNVYDATGANVATAGPATIRVANPGAPGAAPGGPGSTAPQVVGGRIAPLRPRRNLRRQHAKQVVVRGRLLDAAGQAVAGAPVAVFSTLDVPGARERPVGSTTTAADGSFRFVLPKGGNRRISVRHEGATAWRFRLGVPAPIRLIPSRKQLDNGEKLVLTAYLLNAKAPARSADVAFQVRIGKQWRTFAKAPLDKRGLAQIEHRFRVTFHRMTYRFRAMVLKRKNFPFDNATSPRVSVRVN